MDYQAFAALLGNYGKFSGSVAVFSTSAYLAIQVRHSKVVMEANTKSLILQSYQAWQAANAGMNMSVSIPAQSEIVARSSFDSTNLSEETYVFDAMFHLALMHMAQSAIYLYRAGTLDEELKAAEMSRAAGVLAAPGVRQWWDAGGERSLLLNLRSDWSLPRQASVTGLGRHDPILSGPTPFPPVRAATLRWLAV